MNEIVHAIYTDICENLSDDFEIHDLSYIHGIRARIDIENCHKNGYISIDLHDDHFVIGSFGRIEYTFSYFEYDIEAIVDIVRNRLP